MFIKMLSEHLYVILNFGIIILTAVESYMFPLALVKWMIVITKYGGLLNVVKGCVKSNQDVPKYSRFKYNLHLITNSKHGNDAKSDSIRNSYVNFVMETMNDGGRSIQLTYYGQDCEKIPPALCKSYGHKTLYLDLSYNRIETLWGLEQFTKLQELILDNNKLGDGAMFPYMPWLKTLSLNNNQINNLKGLMDKISVRCPRLTYISLLCNKACPHPLSDCDKDDSDYQRYRHYVLYKLKGLKFLDSRRVTKSERSEADTRGEFMCVRRPKDEADAWSTRYPNEPVLNMIPPLSLDLAAVGKHKGAYGKCKYKYTGKHSEGNRFIVNSDL